MISLRNRINSQIFAQPRDQPAQEEGDRARGHQRVPEPVQRAHQPPRAGGRQGGHHQDQADEARRNGGLRRAGCQAQEVSVSERESSKV